MPVEAARDLSRGCPILTPMTHEVEENHGNTLSSSFSSHPLRNGDTEYLKNGVVLRMNTQTAIIVNAQTIYHGEP